MVGLLGSPQPPRGKRLLPTLEEAAEHQLVNKWADPTHM